MTVDEKSIYPSLLIFDEVCKEKNVEETKQIIEKTIHCVTYRNRKWPSTELCKAVNKMDQYNVKLFLDLLHDMLAEFETLAVLQERGE